MDLLAVLVGLVLIARHWKYDILGWLLLIVGFLALVT